MVSRKYLCSAPNPSKWDEHASALLKSLDGNREKGEELIKNTLAVLSETLEDKKKSGPGRKSNAEHALNFYEYLLNSMKEAKKNSHEQSDKKRSKKSGKNGSKSDDGVDDEASSASIVSMNSQEFLDQHNDLCEICNVGGDLLCCSTCNLVFHLKCTRPHLKVMPPDNWSCSYCVSSGVTGYKREARVRRRASAAVRVMNRMRNEQLRGGSLDSENEGSFGSSNEDNQEESDDELRKDNDGARKNEKNSNSKNTGMKQNRNLKRKREEIVSSDVDEDIKGKRRRRSRKQPTLYDPQDCPASEWQSDGVFEWKTLSASETGIPSDASSSDEDDTGTEDGESIKEDKDIEESDGNEIKQENKPKQKGNESNEDAASKTIWCNFCKDDPSIKVCCFCGCRICFGKHDGSKLLICDQCDEEYHTYCLVPPLDNVPLTQKWYCKTCQAAKEKHKEAVMITRNKLDQSSSKSSNSTAMSCRISPRKTNSAVTEKNKGSNASFGSERRLTSGESSTPISKTGRSASAEKKKPSDEVLAAKTRGKMPVNAKGRGAKAEPERAVASGKQPQIEVKVKRPRGRPPMKKNAAVGASIADSKVGEKRGPGRPRKHPLPTNVKDSASNSPRRVRQTKVAKPAADGSKAKRQMQREIRRSEKGDQDDDSNGNSSGKAKNATGETSLSSVQSVQRSRSGRMVKRSAFHDEMYDDGQPLRATKAQDAIKADAVGEARAVTKNAKVAESKSKATGTAAQRKIAKTEKAADSLISSNNGKTSLKAKSDKKPEISTVTNTPSTKQQGKLSQAGKHNESKVPPTMKPQNSAGAETPSGQALKPSSNDSKTLDVKKKTNLVSTATPAPSSLPPATNGDTPVVKTPRRKPGARECMQISRRFGVQIIPEKYMDTLLDYCSRGKVEHLIRMRERLDEHSRFLEAQLAGLEALVVEKGETDVVVPALEDPEDLSKQNHNAKGNSSASISKVDAPKVTTKECSSGSHTDSSTPAFSKKVDGTCGSGSVEQEQTTSVTSEPVAPQPASSTASLQVPLGKVDNLKSSPSTTKE